MLITVYLVLISYTSYSIENIKKDFVFLMQELPFRYILGYFDFKNLSTITLCFLITRIHRHSTDDYMVLCKRKGIIWKICTGKPTRLSMFFFFGSNNKKQNLKKSPDKEDVKSMQLMLFAEVGIDTFKRNGALLSSVS
jgi:hypothetical protein